MVNKEKTCFFSLHFKRFFQPFTYFILRNFPTPLRLLGPPAYSGPKSVAVDMPPFCLTKNHKYGDVGSPLLNINGMATIGHVIVNRMAMSMDSFYVNFF